MNIFTYLKKDHKYVEELFERIVSTHIPERRKTLFEELVDELLLHAESEHATFYKALKQHDEMKDAIKHADKEHAEIKQYTTGMDQIPHNSDEWLEQLGELKHAVLHHVAEEEGHIFQQAKTLLTKEQLVQLVEDMEKYKYQKIYTSGAA
jgi:hemerythrin superfamily protein